MTDLLQVGAEWLKDQMQASAAQTITYQRLSAGSDEIELLGTKTNSRRSRTRADGVVEIIDTEDFVLPAEDLVIGSYRFLPEPGDRITVTIGSESLTYEVRPYSEGEDCWSWMDPRRIQLRVRVMEVE